MATWEVELRSPDGALRAHRRLRCRSEGDVMTLAGIDPPREGHLYVYRVHRVRGRRLSSVREFGRGRGDGLSGVREPRRPLPPGPDHLSAERDERQPSAERDL